MFLKRPTGPIAWKPGGDYLKPWRDQHGACHVGFLWCLPLNTQKLLFGDSSTLSKHEFGPEGPWTPEKQFYTTYIKWSRVHHPQKLVKLTMGTSPVLTLKWEFPLVMWLVVMSKWNPLSTWMPALWNEHPVSSLGVQITCFMPERSQILCKSVANFNFECS